MLLETENDQCWHC